MAGPRFLVVEHEASCPPRLVGDWLEEAGGRLEVCRPYVGDALPALTSYDAAVVLGGEMGAHDDATVPWLAPLKAGIRDALAAGTPLSYTSSVEPVVGATRTGRHTRPFPFLTASASVSVDGGSYFLTASVSG